jgi:hypothetical protein
VSGEIAQVAAEMMPYVTSAVSAYGGAVLAKVQDDAADGTVGLGRRLLQKIFGRKQADEPLPTVLAKVIDNPGDSDYEGALRVAIREALDGNAQMLAEVREIIAQAKPDVTVGSQSASAGAGGIAQNITATGEVNASHTIHNSGPVLNAGRDAHYAERDMTINRKAD